MRIMKVKQLLFYLLAVLLLGSCVTPRDTNLLQERIKKNYKTEFNYNVDYKIIPGDRLSLSIFTLDENMRTLFSMFMINNTTTSSRQGGGSGGSSSGEGIGGDLPANILNVYSDGTIKIPYINKINVLGLTTFEAKKIIEAKLQEFSPNLTIDLTLQNRYFSVLGEASEGRYAMPTPRMNIFQALAMSGDIDKFGDRAKVNIIRQTPDGTEVKTFDIRSKDILDSEYYYIQPNDVIYVKELSRTFFGRITSFSGLLGGLGLLTSTIAVVVLIVNLTK